MLLVGRVRHASKKKLRGGRNRVPLPDSDQDQRQRPNQDLRHPACPVMANAHAGLTMLSGEPNDKETGPRRSPWDDFRPLPGLRKIAPPLFCMGLSQNRGNPPQNTVLDSPDFTSGPNKNGILPLKSVSPWLEERGPFLSCSVTLEKREKKGALFAEDRF